ncbi:MAG: L-histidine N(alpha)-methyltransferase [Rhodospirillales bacterium]
MFAHAELASFEDCAPESGDFLTDVLAGLSRPLKTLPCKYFYNERGSDLFNRICELPEYYPTRTEKALLQDCAPEIAAVIGPQCCLIEYGTGSSDKMRIMLDALDRPAAFVAVDISKEHLLLATAALAKERPDLNVHAVCADYTKPFDVPALESDGGGKAVAFFPGSSLGNFDPDQASGFLANAAHVVDAGGGMVIGIDLKKDDEILNAAYNDSAGVTAAFNKNILLRINSELGGSFVLDDFKHHAFYNGDKGRVEMHLISRKDQTVRIAGHEFRFRKGESIHTENSYKYDVREFQSLARGAGFAPVQVWTDREGLFSVHYLEAMA